MSREEAARTIAAQMLAAERQSRDDYTTGARMLTMARDRVQVIARQHYIRGRVAWAGAYTDAATLLDERATRMTRPVVLS